ncbi:MAG: radical SAM protein [Verrucomicrobiota bacterium]
MDNTISNKPEQRGLFDSMPPETTPVKIGHATVTRVDSKSILTKATGFMGDFDYTLNPYSGCTFGCTYCYAAFFARDPAEQADWGRWVKVKENAVSQIRRMRNTLTDKTIYMSSVTDPYQPIERQLLLTRSILEELLPHQPRLVIQTRSALVTRDIDLLKQFEHVRVNMTVTTDIEEIRQVFEPWCPTSRHRLRGIAKVHSEGIQTCITMTPLLPIHDANLFADELLATGVERFVVQPFHTQRGRFIAGTGAEANQLLKDYGWTSQNYEAVVETLRSRLPRLDEGRSGFEPA